MIEVLKGLALQLQGFDNADLPRVVLVAGGPRDLDLLDGNHLTSCGVQRQVDAAVRALPDEFATDPTEDRCSVMCKHPLARRVRTTKDTHVWRRLLVTSPRMWTTTGPCPALS